MDIFELALELLDDEHGITQDAWSVLHTLMENEDEDKASKIAKATKGCEGRVYLPEGVWEKLNI